jgi:hypothetical protein
LTVAGLGEVGVVDPEALNELELVFEGALVAEEQQAPVLRERRVPSLRGAAGCAGVVGEVVP